MPIPNRQALIRQGQRLEYFTVAYNSAEGLVSIVAGLIAGSVSLIGFGLDSIIEVASGAALCGGSITISTSPGVNKSSGPRCESSAWCFIALALYILYESGSTLIGHKAPEPSIPGIIVAIVSLVVMPLLARAKRRVAAGIGERSHDRRFQTGRFLHLPVCDPARRPVAECVVGLVVG
jgi:divalent metal cation (Fe/Co/Zn/Cd) transporter